MTRYCEIRKANPFLAASGSPICWWDVMARMKRLDEMTSKEFAETVDGKTIVILPMGIIEEHGPHLPLCTDSLQAEHLAERLAQRFGALVLPPLRYGNSSSTIGFPGTISLSFDTIRALVKDIVSELVRNGVRKVMVLSSHAGSGHLCAIREAVKDVVIEADGRGIVVRGLVVSDYEVLYGLTDRGIDPRDGHAGDMETSRVMVLRPGLVKNRSQAKDSTKKIPDFLVIAHPEKEWTGIRGFPSKASKKKGQMLEDMAFEEISKLMRTL